VESLGCQSTVGGAQHSSTSVDPVLEQSGKLQPRASHGHEQLYQVNLVSPTPENAGFFHAGSSTTTDQHAGCPARQEPDPALLQRSKTDPSDHPSPEPRDDNDDALIDRLDPLLCAGYQGSTQWRPNEEPIRPCARARTRGSEPL
jgi:hypothetical protein